jgi:hypothetical protein
VNRDDKQNTIHRTCHRPEADHQCRKLSQSLFRSKNKAHNDKNVQRNINRIEKPRDILIIKIARLDILDMFLHARHRRPSITFDAFRSIPANADVVVDFPDKPNQTDYHIDNDNLNDHISILRTCKTNSPASPNHPSTNQDANTQPTNDRTDEPSHVHSFLVPTL